MEDCVRLWCYWILLVCCLLSGNVCGKLEFAGMYQGNCKQDGIYYKGIATYVVCTHGIGYVQACPSGTRNAEFADFTAGSTYQITAFCTINLNDKGYSVYKHSQEHEQHKKQNQQKNSHTQPIQAKSLLKVDNLGSSEEKSKQLIAYVYKKDLKKKDSGAYDSSFKFYAQPYRTQGEKKNRRRSGFETTFSNEKLSFGSESTEEREYKYPSVVYTDKYGQRDTKPRYKQPELSFDETEPYREEKAKTETVSERTRVYAGGKPYEYTIVVHPDSHQEDKYSPPSPPEKHYSVHIEEGKYHFGELTSVEDRNSYQSKETTTKKPERSVYYPHGYAPPAASSSPSASPPFASSSSSSSSSSPSHTSSSSSYASSPSSSAPSSFSSSVYINKDYRKPNPSYINSRSHRKSAYSEDKNHRKSPPPRSSYGNSRKSVRSYPKRSYSKPSSDYNEYTADEFNEDKIPSSYRKPGYSGIRYQRPKEYERNRYEARDVRQTGTYGQKNQPESRYRSQQSEPRYEGDYKQTYKSNQRRSPRPGGQNPNQYDRKQSQYDESPGLKDRKPRWRDSNPNQYERKASQYEKNPSQYDRNPNQYDKNSRQYNKNPRQYDTTPSKYDKNPSQYDKNPSQYDTYPSQYNRRTNYGRGQSEYERDHQRGSSQYNSNRKKTYNNYAKDRSSSPAGRGGAPEYGVSKGDSRNLPTGYRTNTGPQKPAGRTRSYDKPKPRQLSPVESDILNTLPGASTYRDYTKHSFAKPGGYNTNSYHKVKDTFPDVDSLIMKRFKNHIGDKMNKGSNGKHPGRPQRPSGPQQSQGYPKRTPSSQQTGSSRWGSARRPKSDMSSRHGSVVPSGTNTKRPSPKYESNKNTFNNRYRNERGRNDQYNRGPDYGRKNNQLGTKPSSSDYSINNGNRYGQSKSHFDMKKNIYDQGNKPASARNYQHARGGSPPVKRPNIPDTKYSNGKSNSFREPSLDRKPFDGTKKFNARVSSIGLRPQRDNTAGSGKPIHVNYAPNKGRSSDGPHSRRDYQGYPRSTDKFGRNRGGRQADSAEGEIVEPISEGLVPLEDQAMVKTSTDTADQSEYQQGRTDDAQPSGEVKKAGFETFSTANAGENGVEEEGQFSDEVKDMIKDMMNDSEEAPNALI